MLNSKATFLLLFISLFFNYVVSTRILTLGDQIVVGSVPGGFRTNMYYKLIDDGYNVDMIGTQTSNPYSNEMDPDHEGYSDKPISFFNDIDYFQNLRESIEAPDVIIAYAGTTDFEQDIEIPMVVYRYASLLENLATIFPSANIIASTLLGSHEDPFIDTLFNENLNDRIFELTMKDLKVTLADVASAVSIDQMADAVFPTQEGYNIMAQEYVNAIEAVVTPLGDTDEPIITDALNPSSNRIKLNFSKPLSDESDLDVSNFEVDYGIEVNSVVLLSNKRSIILTTSDFSEYSSQEVPLKVTVIEGIKDQTGKFLAPNSSIVFLLGGSSGGFTTEGSSGGLTNDSGSISAGTSYPTLPPAPLLGIETLPPVISSSLPKSTTRILPLGDMLTIGGSYAGGYRNHLFDLLTAEDYNVEMIGTRNENPGKMALNHEGWKSKSIDWFLNLVPDILEKLPDPDVILIHLGMDDFTSNNVTTENLVTAVHRYKELIMNIYDLRPHVNIIATNLLQHELWQIDDKVESNFNDEIQDMVESVAEKGAKVSFLDMRSAVNPIAVKEFNNDLDLSDPQGYVKMADAWFASILRVIGPHGDFSDPVIVRVKVPTYKQIDITFSKPIRKEGDKRKFELEYDIKVKSVRLNDDKRTLTLTTSNFSSLEGSPLILTIRNNAVFDRTSERRMVPKGTTYTFQVPLRSDMQTTSPDSTPSPSPSLAISPKIPSNSSGKGKGKGKKKGGKGGKGKGKGKKKGGKGNGKKASSTSSRQSIPSPSPVANPPTYRSSGINSNSSNNDKEKSKKGKKKGKRLRR